MKFGFVKNDGDGRQWNELRDAGVLPENIVPDYWDALMKRASEGDVILALHPSRIARNYMQLAEIADAVSKRGIEVRFLQLSGLEMGSPSSRLMYQMLAALGEYERKMAEEMAEETDYIETLDSLIDGFRYELCEVCGQDADRHAFAPDPLGHPHAYCLDEESND